MHLDFNARPPKKTCSSSIGLLAPQPGEERECVLLGPMCGLETHWVSGRTIPCLGESECRVHHEPVTWKGFAPVLCKNWTWRGKSPGDHLGVLVVTEEIGVDVDVLARGSIFTVRRNGPKRNSPLSLIVKGTWNLEVDLPASFDVKPYVLRATGLGTVIQLRLRRAE